MKSIPWKACLAGALLSFVAAGAAWALPTEAEVQAQVKAGQYEQAERSMAEVVAAKPDSAKAHYVYAEILAHERKFDDAARHAQRAKALDPAVKFTQPEKFKSFEALLEREQHGVARERVQPAPQVTSLPGAGPLRARAAADAPSRPTGVPGWVWGGGLAVLAVLLWKALSRGFAAPVAGTAAAMPMSGPVSAPVGGYGGYGMGPAPSGSGLRTGLAAGAGLAGGLAAGVLLDEMLHRGDSHGAASAAPQAPATDTSGLLGGVEPGFFDREMQQDAADQLASRDIDFGNGDRWDDGGTDSSSSGSDDW